MKLLSIIVPVYNVKPYLEMCVESIMKQTYTELQIILVDDGSTDGSQTVCDELAQKDSRIAVIHKENGGPSTARNSGMEIAAGEFITFVDSDDWIEPNMYHDMITQLEKYDADMAVCSFYECKDDEKKAVGDSKCIKILNTEDIFSNKNQLRFLVWNKIFRKSLVEKLRFVPGQGYEDFHFCRQAFLQTRRLVYLDVPFYNYRISRPGNTNSSFKPGRMCIFGEFDALINDLTVLHYDKARTAMIIYALEFYRRLYKEACELNAGADVKEKIRKNFVRYYDISRKENIKLAKGLCLFYFFPNIDAKRAIARQRRASGFMERLRRWKN